MRQSFSAKDSNNIILEFEEKKPGIEMNMIMTSHDPYLVGAMIGSFIENGKLGVSQNGSV